MLKPPRIAPSILAADLAHLADQVALVSPYVDLLHIDVMDGHFVPNLTFGIPVIASLRHTTDLYFDCHMMTTNADAYLTELAAAGANLVSVHLEIYPDPTGVAAMARAAGLDFGLVVSPSVPYEAAAPFVELCDLLLIMTVNPGFGGQEFMAGALEKVRAARETVDSSGLEVDIQVDGGVSPETAPLARAAGADIFVAGTGIFGDDDPATAAKRLRASVEEVDARENSDRG